jgi:tetratricopeptide (TPR) repeat protein
LLSATDPILIPDIRLSLEKYDEIFYLKRTDGFENAVLAEQNAAVFETKAHTTVKSRLIDLKKDIIQFLSKGRWLDVINSCQQVAQEYENDAELSQFMAKALVVLGHLEKAKAAGETSARLNDLDPHTHLLLGAIYMQLGEYNNAESACRKTIFLNYDFVEAHYQLAQVLLYQGRGKQAIRMLEKSLTLAARMEPDRKVHNVLPLTYAGFTDILTHELRFYKKYAGNL